MSSGLFESLRFRVHVRNLLYDFVKKHCTIDYLTFTEGLVSEFLQDLELVPLTDPYSLTLPVDPLDTLEKIYSELPPYSPYNDVWQLSQECVASLKEAFKDRPGKRKTDRVVMTNSYGPAPPQEPFYPALTRRARQSTKKLGCREVEQPCTLKELFEEHKLPLLELENFEEPTVDLEDTLKVKIPIDPGDQPSVKSLLHSILGTLRPEKPYTNRHLDSTTLCSQFPAEPTYTAPEEVFMPIFPRRCRIGISAPATGVELADFKCLIENVPGPFGPVDIINHDEDIPRQNLVLVDGWQAIRSSPPSTPSSKGSDGIDELDDIRFPSSPTTSPPPVQELEKYKMDQILVPRSRRIGGKGGIKPHILRGKTLRTFLTPLLSQPRTEREVPKQRVPSPTPSSLIGQPPSAIDLGDDLESEANDHFDFDVGFEIQKVCEGYDLEPDFFIDETIDDKTALLMEVPTLPQPNEFPKSFYVPKSLSELVIPSAAKGGERHRKVDPLYRFLKKVKGWQSLNLELSWVPFTTNEQVPTLLEILDVVDPFPQQPADFKQGLWPMAAEPLVDVSIRRGLEAGPGDLVYVPPTEEFRKIIRASLSLDDDLDSRQNLLRSHVQESTGDVSISPPRAGPEDPRPFEPSEPSNYLDLPMRAGDDGGPPLSLKRQSSGDLADFSPSCEPELAGRSLGSFSFAQLRARKVSMPRLEPDPVENLVTPPRTVERIDLPRGPPREVCDANTIYLPEPITPQTRSSHKYMACLELIQKQALVRALCSRDCAVELVERRDLDGVDLILDTETAVIFLNLFSLPAWCEACVDKIAKGSWKYERLLIVFEAYGELSAEQHRPTLSQPYAYTPPIVKALRKFKRDLSIAEAYGTMRTATVLQYGFADTVEEAALFTRMYGDWCEAYDKTHGAIWGNRDWLDVDSLEHEEANLASLKGINHFSASIILCQASLQEFIDLAPEERISAFGAHILVDRIRECNEDLDARFADADASEVAP